MTAQDAARLDEELLEAAAEAMHAYTLTYTGEEDNYFQNLARAALEVFRREQGARDEDLREAAIANLLRAREMVGDLCSGKQRWVMSIPARPEHDPDLVIVFGIDAALDALGHRREAAPATEEVE